MPPAIVDLTGESDSATPERDIVSKPHLREQLRRAKGYGVYLSLSEDNQESRARREIVSRFLKEFQTLRDIETAVLTEQDDSPEAEPEDEEGEESEGERTPEPTAREVSRLKRKGYPINPICSHCERQFDEDDNPAGCCRYHSGTMDPDTSNDYWADADNPEEMDYDGEEPDAWQWSCCEGNARADACKASTHVESVTSKKARISFS